MCCSEGGHVWQEQSAWEKWPDLEHAIVGEGGRLASRTCMGVQGHAREKALTQAGLGSVGLELLGLP